MRFDLDLSFGSMKKNINWELLYPICGALVMLMLRNVCRKYIFTKIGLRLGLKQIEVKKAPHDAVLEKAYSISKKWKLDRVRGLAKQLDVSEKEVESWLELRNAQDRPSVLIKFSGSFWACCYYTLAWTAAALIVWDKPWFWNVKQCWMNIPDQTVTRDVWWHLMITLSFYMSELMGLFFDVKRKDFWSMFIHHVVSIVLFFFAWKSNLYRMFMVALVLLDCSEILLEVS
ncbi:ceramide synthase 5-like [Tenebrio molitor]|uniref:ceramide synthase 5-like n=1 Tax=Tenebrio molitor TaxID=7067 RepID=UPI00362497AC